MNSICVLRNSWKYSYCQKVWSDHSILIRMESSFHSHRNEVSILVHSKEIFFPEDNKGSIGFVAKYKEILCALIGYLLISTKVVN